MLPFSPQPTAAPVQFVSAPSSAPNSYAQAYYWPEQQRQLPQSSVASDFGYHQATASAIESGDLHHAPAQYSRQMMPYAIARQIHGGQDSVAYQQQPTMSVEHQQYAPVHYSSVYQTPTDVSVSHTTADEGSYGNSYSSPADASDAPEDQHQHQHQHQQQQQQQYEAYYAMSQYRQMAQHQQHQSAQAAQQSGYTAEASTSGASTSLDPSSRRSMQYSDPQLKYYRQSAYHPESSDLAPSAGYVPLSAADSNRYPFSSEWQSSTLLESNVQAPTY